MDLGVAGKKPLEGLRKVVREAPDINRCEKRENTGDGVWQRAEARNHLSSWWWGRGGLEPLKRSAGGIEEGVRF